MPTKPADSYHARLITERRFDRVDGISALLDSLYVSPGLEPTSWATMDQESLPWDRKAFMARFVKIDGGFLDLYLRRTKSPRYSISLHPSLSRDHLMTLGLSAKGLPTRWVHPLYELVSRLAETGRVHFGYLKPTWKSSRKVTPWNNTNVIGVTDYLRFGPGFPGARTWFGRYVIDLVGASTLRETFAEVRDLEGGIIEADLVTAPWEASFRQLADAHKGAVKELLATGFVGDYNQRLRSRRKDTPSWMPPALKWTY